MEERKDTCACGASCGCEPHAEEEAKPATAPDEGGMPSKEGEEQGDESTPSEGDVANQGQRK